MVLVKNQLDVNKEKMHSVFFNYSHRFESLDYLDEQISKYLSHWKILNNSERDSVTKHISSIEDAINRFPGKGKHGWYYRLMTGGTYASVEDSLNDYFGSVTKYFTELNERLEHEVMASSVLLQHATIGTGKEEAGRKNNG